MGLGTTIGKVTDNFTITNDAGDKVQIRLTYDFSTATDADIKSWLSGNRRIALQRPSRSLSRTELEELNGQTLMAIDAGKKVKSREERITVYTAIGVPRDLAELAVDDPGRFQELMKQVDTDEGELDENVDETL